MNWIRVATKIKDDVSIAKIADACKIRISEAVGCVVCVLAQFPEHAREGGIAEIPDLLIEQWAGWEGKRGRFASAFRAHMCTDEGVTRSWEKYNGAAIRDSDAARLRAQNWREEQKRTKKERNKPPEDTPNVRRTERSTKPITYTTDVDVDEELTASSAVAAEAVSAGGDEKTDDLRSQFDEPRHVLAFERHMRASGSPEAFRLELEALSRERPSDGQPGIPWAVIGQALHEISLDGRRATSGMIRVFADTVQRRERGEFDRPPTSFIGNPVTPAPTWDELIAREEAPAHVE